ncbi:MAG: hypothetical protein WAM85_00565 [Terracidiphilus sp.]
MRRILPVAILGLLLAACLAAVAQRGGGGHFGGHAGGFAGGGFHGGFSAPRSFGGFSGFAQRGFSTTPRMAWSAPRYSAAPRYRSAFRPAYNASRRGRDPGRRHPYRSPYRGAYGYPYSYGNSWELLPWDLGYPDFTGYDEDSGTYQQSDQGEPQPQYVPPPDEGYRQDYNPRPYQTAAAPASPPALEPQLTLIFQDGHTQTIRNYVMTPSTMIVMDQAASGRELRIPLSELNLPATERAAQQAGLDFAPPAS